VTSYPFPIQRAIKITKDNKVEMFQPENYQTRSQDLEPAYHDAGQFYWLTVSGALSITSKFSTNSSPIILPRSRVQDIDTEEDWSYAELMFKALHDF
jgi:N-acylneuraminate cytidylyltransferase